MSIPVIDSIKVIEQQYHTGEEPVLVMCSNMNAYVVSDKLRQLFDDKWTTGVWDILWSV